MPVPTPDNPQDPNPNPDLDQKAHFLSRPLTANGGVKRPQAYLCLLKCGVDACCCSVDLKRKTGKPFLRKDVGKTSRQQEEELSCMIFIVYLVNWEILSKFDLVGDNFGTEPNLYVHT
ncbi:hypothetical protein AMECASPLE_012037 [Ameca splendens]|uniref:Uncharacterized protein n=1 Tax=Ameca splendens TaxID=208324 RepID=A0ABV0ZKP5_9TELE